MLHGAATADAEMRAGRRDALRARFLDAKELAPIGLAGHVLNLHGFARQRRWNKDRSIGAFGDAIAAVADPVDHEVLNHDWPQ
jgi:hypothetical protein